MNEKKPYTYADCKNQGRPGTRGDLGLKGQKGEPAVTEGVSIQSVCPIGDAHRTAVHSTLNSMKCLRKSTRSSDTIQMPTKSNQFEIRIRIEWQKVKAIIEYISNWKMFPDQR